MHVQHANMQAQYDMSTCRHNMPTCQHAGTICQHANMQAQCANMPTCRHNMPTCQHAGTICQHAICTNHKCVLAVCQHAICSATCCHACTTCLRNMYLRSAKHSASLHPPTYVPLRMASFGCGSGRSSLGVMRSYVSSLIIDITVTFEHVSNLLEEASHLLQSQGRLETSQPLTRQPY